MSETKDTRIKLDTTNSDLVRSLSDATGENPQVLIHDALKHKDLIFAIKELPSEDQAFFNKIQKIHETEINLFLDIIREKALDSDKILLEQNNIRLTDQKTIKALTESLDKANEEIRNLSKMLADCNSQITELKQANENTTKLDEAFSMLKQVHQMQTQMMPNT